MKDIAVNECELIPNRVFVGALPFPATEQELKEYFNNLTGCDNVKEMKIIIDYKGCSKGFGFLTFETEEEASKVLSLNPDSFIFNETKLNIAHAYRRTKPYQNNNKYHRNDQTAAGITVQTDNIKAERFCMSPNSGKVLNLFTPTLASMTDAKGTEVALASDESQTIDKAVKEASHVNNEENGEQQQAVRLVLTDTKTNECIEIGSMEKEDDNNNIITTKRHDLNSLESTQKEAVLGEEKTSPTEIVNDETTTTAVELDTTSHSQTNTNSKPNSYTKGNTNNHRAYNNGRNNNKGNNNRYQQNNLNYNQYLTVQTPSGNNSYNKNGNQFSSGSQPSKGYQTHNANFNQTYGHQASVQYYYAMAAAMAGNIHSPKQSTNPMHKHKQVGEMLKTTGQVAKSSNDFVGSIMHSYPNVHANQTQSVDAQFVPTSYQTNGTTKSGKTPYGYGVNAYSNRQGVSSQNSGNLSENSSGYVNSTSAPSNPSSSASSVASNTPVNFPVSYSSSNYPNGGQANNTAVNYVNHVASINSSTLASTAAPPQQPQHGINGQEMNYAPQYLNQYYYQVSQPNMHRPHLNPPVTNTGEYNASQSAATDQLVQQHSNYSQTLNKPQQVYYTSSLPNSASTLPQQAAPDATNNNNNYQKQTPISTISNAFETATNSNGTDNNNNNINAGQSTDNLDELMQKKLNLQQPSTEMTQQQQYYYISQPTQYTQNNPIDNGQAPPLQHYYVYYPSNQALPGQHYQYPMQPIPSYIPAQQQPGIPAPMNGAYLQPVQQPPSATFPIQVNTMNANHLSMQSNNSGPHSAPLPHYMPNYPQQQQSQYQMVRGLPLLQIPPPPAGQYQQQHSNVHVQYSDNRMKLQSPNSQAAKGMQQMAKGQFYQGHMYQNQPRGTVRQKSFNKSDSVSNRS